MTEYDESPSGTWKYRRALGIERRKAWVERRLKEPVLLPVVLEEFLEEHRDVFTGPQLQALVYRISCEMPAPTQTDSVRAVLRPRNRHCAERMFNRSWSVATNIDG